VAFSLLFSKEKSRSEIDLRNVSTSAIHLLTSHEKDAYFPKWSPDLSARAFLSERTGKAQIGIQDRQKRGEEKELTPFAGLMREFTRGYYDLFPYIAVNNGLHEALDDDPEMAVGQLQNAL
jgi:Tol biopolymer transport system component